MSKMDNKARALNKWIGDDDEFFEDKKDVAEHYHIIRFMMDDYWVMKNEYPNYINPMHLHLCRETYNMKDIKKMKCKGCCMCDLKQQQQVEQESPEQEV